MKKSIEHANFFLSSLFCVLNMTFCRLKYLRIETDFENFSCVTFIMTVAESKLRLGELRIFSKTSEHFQTKKMFRDDLGEL